MRGVYNALTREQRRWVAEAARLRRAARTYKGANYDDEFRARDTRVSDAAHSEWAAKQAVIGTTIAPDTLDALLDFLARYLPLHGDGTWPDITVDTPWRCEVDGSMVDNANESCASCARRDAEQRQHVKRMRRIGSRIEAEGLGATAGTRNAVSIDAFVLDRRLDELQRFRDDADTVSAELGRRTA